LIEQKTYLCIIKVSDSMPLFQGDTQAIITMNIRKLISEGYSAQQAVAIANAEAAKSRKRGK
jgi:hypothetical protein